MIQQNVITQRKEKKKLLFGGTIFGFQIGFSTFLAFVWHSVKKPCFDPLRGGRFKSKKIQKKVGKVPQRNQFKLDWNWCLTAVQSLFFILNSRR